MEKKIRVGMDKCKGKSGRRGSHEQGVRLSLEENRFIAEISVVQTKKGKRGGSN